MLTLMKESGQFMLVMFKRCKDQGAWMSQSVKRLPSAQIMIPECWD